ncbi:MAG: crossover junction endodeoxyribonuclease RuvC [Bryobacterales bacterium]|nr:crossover junction endodeoxyribonuclease RuvC [Bryobacterales bacterium]
MRIVGIDCGSKRTGYGVIETDGRRHRLLTCGVISTSTKHAFGERLRVIHDGLRNLLEEHSPDEMAVEGVFAAVNPRSALRLAHVRGVALLAAAQSGLPVGEYSPLEVKGSVVGYGKATKDQVRVMVSSLLGSDQDEINGSFDASDALAVALCHSMRSAGGKV